MLSWECQRVKEKGVSFNNPQKDGKREKANPSWGRGTVKEGHELKRSNGGESQRSTKRV